MTAESKPAPTSSSRWGMWLWSVLLAGLVSCWVVWGALAFMKMEPAERMADSSRRTRRPGRKRQVWKRPNYQKFKTFRAAVAAAKAMKKPIFLDLYADWCVPCKKLERETFSHPIVHPVMAKYLVVKFNVDFREGKRLARRFRVRYYPTTLMLNSDGREVERVIGFYAARYYRPVLVSVLKGEGHYYNLIRRNRRNPKDLQVMVDLATRSILRRRVRQARALYQRALKADPQGKQGIGPQALFGIARTYSRVGKYRQAMPHLASFLRRFPQPGKFHREAMRLQMYGFRRLRQFGKYRASLARFRKLYPGFSAKFK